MASPPTDDEWNRSADDEYDVSALLEHGVIFEEARTVLIGTEGPKPTDVLLILGDHYTMWSSGAFKAWADRILRQLR